MEVHNQPLPGIIDNDVASLLDLAYLVSCHPSAPIFWGGKKICVEVYRPARFCRQSYYHQQLLGIVNSRLIIETTFMQANIFVRMYAPANQVAFRGSDKPHGENATLKYAHWSHAIIGATCTVVYILRPPVVSSGKKRKGATSKNPPLFGVHSASRGGKRRGGRKQSRARRL